ncbi:hypothetical protein [Microbispora siamensis]|uniref:Uncharacterized protein n=1 Tax=Microbispora siamensis TaxID=564413 RepID=A0ABQ4H157_9ACTN|nr:hypothetical protein [Microbispora siamensis]GIH67414.1 hypothetical protein Msi02_82310 [Microbispora siamensis]
MPHDPQKTHATDHVPAQQGAQQSWTHAIQQGLGHWYSQFGAHTQNDSAFTLVVPLQKKDDDWPIWGHKSYPAWHDSRSATDQRRRHAHKKHKVHGHHPA